MTDVEVLAGGHERTVWLLGRMQAAMGQPDPAGGRAFRQAYDELNALVHRAQVREEALMAELGPAIPRDLWLSIRDEHDEISEFLTTIGRTLERDLGTLRGWAVIGLSAVLRRHLKREATGLFPLASAKASTPA